MQPEIDALIELQVRRKFIIKMDIANTNMLKALVARMCGFDPNGDEADRKRLWNRASKIVSTVFAGKPQKPEDLAVSRAIAPEMEMMRLMLQPLWARRAEVEDEMERLAAELPVYDRLDIAGFKAIGLAVIIAEAGNLSNYSTVRKLWRRLGLGMAKGHEAHAYSTWRRAGGLSAEDWTLAGYSPKRLGQVFGVVTVPLFMSKARNRYGDVYARRRARTAITHPEWTKGHSDNDARRVMTKALISDLWSEWRRSIGIVAEESSAAPAAATLTWSTPSLQEIAA